MEQGETVGQKDAAVLEREREEETAQQKGGAGGCRGEMEQGQVTECQYEGQRHSEPSPVG
jgi:hypothetical protein